MFNSQGGILPIRRGENGREIVLRPCKSFEFRVLIGPFERVYRSNLFRVINQLGFRLEIYIYMYDEIVARFLLFLFIDH